MTLETCSIKTLAICSSISDNPPSFFPHDKNGPPLLLLLQNKHSTSTWLQSYLYPFFGTLEVFFEAFVENPNSFLLLIYVGSLFVGHASCVWGRTNLSNPFLKLITFVKDFGQSGIVQHKTLRCLVEVLANLQPRPNRSQTDDNCFAVLRCRACTSDRESGSTRRRTRNTLPSCLDCVRNRLAQDLRILSKTHLLNC